MFQIGFKNQRVAGCREIGIYIKFGYWLGSRFKIANSLEILLFLHTIPKALNRLVDPRNRSGQVSTVCNEEKKELVEPQLFPASHCIIEKNLGVVAKGNWDSEQDFNGPCKTGYFGQFPTLDFVCNVGYPRQLVAVIAMNGRFKNTLINHKV